MGRFLTCVLLGSAAVAAPQDTAVTGLRGEVLGTNERFDLAVGGEFSSPWTPPTSAAVVGPGIYAVTLNNTGTGWAERFLIGLPQTGAGAAQFAPALVLFHGYGETPESLLQLTDYFAKAQAKGWYVIAPLAAHQFHFSIEYAQRNVEKALGWSASYLNIDLDRLYAVGFSMGGGMATSYASRHQDPARGRFAAIVNHTGTVSVGDVYWSANDKALLSSPLMFGGNPNAEPFAYRRASTIDINPITGSVDDETDMLRNLAQTPVRTFHATYDPLVYLVDQSTAFDQTLTSRGGTSNLVMGNASVHKWETMDETATLDWFDGRTLSDPVVGQTHRVLADRAGRWHAFHIVPYQNDEFTPLTWNANAPQNRLYVVGTKNLRRLSFHPAKLGLDPGRPLSILFGSDDGQPTNLAISGLEAAPTSVERNGNATSAWVWNPTKKLLILREIQAGFTPTWTIQP